MVLGGDLYSRSAFYKSATSFSKTYSAQTHFLNSHIIEVEVDLSKGLHAFYIVGLPDKAVEEAKDRISAAIKNSGFVCTCFVHAIENNKTVKTINTFIFFIKSPLSKIMCISSL